ncbi:MAG: precorrin-6y C5,15-methyltransferase (decarboxylating) subunit CbiE [Marinibacterium sp.]
MAEPWLSIIGLGEDGPAGLSEASRAALRRAEIVMGPRRHLDLLGLSGADCVEWPVPFTAGIDRLMQMRGRKVSVLTSGDPFWFGAGSVLARHLDREEWHAFPAPSAFSLAAARLGWPLEHTVCLGLHAAPLDRLRPHLAPGARLIVLLRDGEAMADLAGHLVRSGFGDAGLTVMEALGGPRERLTQTRADALPAIRFAHPVTVAITCHHGPALPCSSGLADDLFDHDGQITKRPVRALTLSALAARPGEYLWDIGGGSGSVAIEWLLAHPRNRASSIEPDPARADRIAANAARLGVDRLDIVRDRAPRALDRLSAPDAVFVGGGLNRDLLEALFAHLAPGTRLVANAVTLESEALLIAAQTEKGGDLLRIDLARAAPIGRRSGWSPAYPIVQWSVCL